MFALDLHTVVVFAKSIVIGLMVAAPVGPIGVLCIHRSLSKNRLSGFISGLGAATADALCASVAAFGLTGISSFLLHHQFNLRLVGGFFLLYMGLKLFYGKAKETETHSVENIRQLKDFLSALFLTITNPLTIISFGLIFATTGFHFVKGDTGMAILAVTGVFIGSTLWWFLLSVGAGYLASKTKSFSLAMVNKISGTLITVFGLMILLSLLRHVPGF